MALRQQHEEDPAKKRCTMDPQLLAKHQRDHKSKKSKDRDKERLENHHNSGSYHSSPVAGHSDQAFTSGVSPLKIKIKCPTLKVDVLDHQSGSGRKHSITPSETSLSSAAPVAKMSRVMGTPLDLESAYLNDAISFH